MAARILLALFFAFSASSAMAEPSICQVIPARDQYNTQIAAITVNGELIVGVVTTYLAYKALRKLESLNACYAHSICKIGRLNNELVVIVNGRSEPVEDIQAAITKLAEWNAMGTCG